MSLTDVQLQAEHASRVMLRRAGFFDGMYDLEPSWLGKYNYRAAFELGRRWTLETPIEGYTLIGASPDACERVYRHTETGTEVYVHLDEHDFHWHASVPGYGVNDLWLSTALQRSLNGGPCNGYGGIPVKNWITSGSPDAFRRVKLFAKA